MFCPVRRRTLLDLSCRSKEVVYVRWYLSAKKCVSSQYSGSCLHFVFYFVEKTWRRNTKRKCFVSADDGSFVAWRHDNLSFVTSQICHVTSEIRHVVTSQIRRVASRRFAMLWRHLDFFSDSRPSLNCCQSIVSREVDVSSNSSFIISTGEAAIWLYSRSKSFLCCWLTGGIFLSSLWRSRNKETAIGVTQSSPSLWLKLAFCSIL